MIRWCSYCQAFLGEKAPFDDPIFSHGICDTCEARLKREEPVHADTEFPRTLVRRLLDAASARDGAACDGILAEAESRQLPEDSLLIGILQPALYQAGLDWRDGTMSVAAEHFLTSWCERAFATMPLPHAKPPLDVLIFQPPDNAHTLGPRFAGRVLAARGVSVDVVVPSVPLVEMIALIERFSPTFVGLSCALPSSAITASELVARLREQLEPDPRRRYVLSGFGVRTARPSNLDPTIEVVDDVVRFASTVLAARS